MRTNGLVGCLIIGLGFVVHGRATGQTNPSNNVETRGVVSDVSAGADQSAICCQSPDSYIFPDGWHDVLIGSTSAYHLYAGTEFTALSVESQTGGRTTLSFSDTTAPGVATLSIDAPGGVDDVGYAPRVWLGAQLTDKWGVRGRYWRLSDTDSHFS